MTADSATSSAYPDSADAADSAQPYSADADSASSAAADSSLPLGGALTRVGNPVQAESRDESYYEPLTAFGAKERRREKDKERKAYHYSVPSGLNRTADQIRQNQGSLPQSLAVR